MKKICKECGQLKEHQAHGLCNSCYYQEWIKHNKKLKQQFSKEYYEKNKEQILHKRRIYDQTHKGKIKEYHKKHKEKIANRLYNYYQNTTTGQIRIHNGYIVYKGGKALHRVIAEKILGRKLKSNEHVHHINGNILDNRNCNLLICTRSYHTYLHSKIAGGFQ